MKKIIVTAAISMAVLVGCTSQPEPAPTVTITEQSPASDPAPLDTDDGLVTNSQEFVDFVRKNGGPYGQIASDADILNVGGTVCDGFAGGLSEDEITYILATALVENGMNNDDGAQFGAALIVGARNYLCDPYIF